MLSYPSLPTFEEFTHDMSGDSHPSEIGISPRGVLRCTLDLLTRKLNVTRLEQSEAMSSLSSLETVTHSSGCQGLGTKPTSCLKSLFDKLSGWQLEVHEELLNQEVARDILWNGILANGKRELIESVDGFVMG